MVRRLSFYLTEGGDGLDILDDDNGDYVDYDDYAKLEEELDRVKQCYLTLRESKAKRKDYETELACGSGDILRVECKKMAEMREALRDALKLSGFLASCARGGEVLSEVDETWISEVQGKAREVLGDE